MEKSKRGRGYYHENGDFEFKSFVEGKPESKMWLTLESTENGRIECSKKLARMVITLNRCDVDKACSSFVNSAFELSAMLTRDKDAQARYELAASLKPCEITYEEDVPTIG